MTQGKLYSGLPSGKDFRAVFKPQLLEILPNENVSRVAVLVTSEYEGIFKNGGIGTYYRALSERLASEGWYVLLLLTFTAETFAGKTRFGVLKHVFSTAETEDCLALEPLHLNLLSTLRQQDEIDRQSFSCLFFLQAICAHFSQSTVYVEFPEMMGCGYRAIQAKQLGLFPNRCILATTLHSGHEWVYEVNGRFTEEYPRYLWQVCHYEQYSFEHADLAFFPSHFLKSKVGDYGWQTHRAVHMPNYVPVVDTSHAQASPPPTLAGRPIVFFGRLEERKGFCVFIQAIKQLPERLKKTVHITFVGKEVQLYSAELKHLKSGQYIEQELSAQVAYSIFPDFYSQEAIQFITTLLQPIVCLTSPQENFANSGMEMGQLPIQLVVADTGGFREPLQLIGRTSGVHWFTPENPCSLRQVLTGLLESPQPTPAVPARAFLEQVNRDLLANKLTQVEQVVSTKALPPQTATVSVAVICRNDVCNLLESLSSIEAQTHPAIAVHILMAKGTCYDEQLQHILQQARDRFPQYTFWISQDGLAETSLSLADLEASRYLAVLEADDLLYPFAIEKLVQGASCSGALLVLASAIYSGSADEVKSFADVSLPSLLYTRTSCSSCGLLDIKFLEKFGCTWESRTLFSVRQLQAAVVATGNQVLCHPDPLYKRRFSTNNVGLDLTPVEQFQLRQHLAQLKPSHWSKRQLYMLLTANQHLLQAEERLQLQVYELQHQFQSAQAPTPKEVIPQSTQPQLSKELEALRTRIAAMESSKFWQLRTKWLSFKKRLGLKMDEHIPTG